MDKIKEKLGDLFKDSVASIKVYLYPLDPYLILPTQKKTKSDFLKSGQLTY